MQFSKIIVGAMRLGEWGKQFTTQALEKFIDQCVEIGLIDFDHADIYGGFSTESDFGKVMKRRPDLVNQIKITTKCGIQMPCPRRPQFIVPSYNSSKEHILSSVDQSLKNLEVEKIDLLLLHRPDYLLDAEAVAITFENLKKSGKVLNFGVSNYTRSQFELLNSYFPLITNQIEVSILHLEAFNNGTLDQMLQHKIQTTVWSPFGGGALFKNHELMDEVSGVAKVSQLGEKVNRIKKVAAPLCEKYNLAFDQLMLAWLNTHPSKMIPIVGTSKFERIVTSLAAMEVVINHQDWYDLYQASSGTVIP